MNKKYKFIKIILGVIILLFLLIFSFNTINSKHNLSFFEKAIKDTSVFFEKVFYVPFDFVKDKIDIYNEKKDLYEKYTQLKEQQEKTKLYYEQIKVLQNEISELKSILELNATLSEYTYENATVVNRNIGYWYNVLTIDKGSKNGVEIGDAVITRDGLIGKIMNVSNFSSTVKLLTTDDINNKIGVKINSLDQELYGLLYGYNKDKNIYKVEGITNFDKVNIGDSVVTTGLTEYFPSGILIGTVVNKVKDEYDLDGVIEVEPSVNFNNISIVTILNRKAK